jgi:hypothetical protein
MNARLLQHFPYDSFIDGFIIFDKTCRKRPLPFQSAIPFVHDKPLTFIRYHKAGHCQPNIFATFHQNPLPLQSLFSKDDAKDNFLDQTSSSPLYSTQKNCILRYDTLIDGWDANEKAIQGQSPNGHY